MKCTALSMKVEVLIGIHIDDACDEMEILSNKIGVVLTADFNGRIITAFPNKTSIVSPPLHEEYKK